MRVTLVQPPSNRFDTSELAPPLGLLCVAAVLERDDIEVSLVDLNLIGIGDPSFVDDGFYPRAARLIADTRPDVVGFTSMALESHICLELGRLLKAEDPAVRIVLGGPHFSAIASAALRFYPWVDHVVVGEGEQPMRDLVRHLRGRLAGRDLKNVARLDGDSFVLQRQMKPHGSLDELPFPAYHLVDVEEYFRLNPYRVLDIEHARGCALRCSFCYSPVHWGQGEQTRRIDRVLEDVQRHYDLGARHLFFVGDNFLNSKSSAIALSDAMAGANPGLTWRCYATLAQLTEDVAESFARSECKYIFIGVDAVSDRSKRTFHKTYFRGWPALKTTLERCLDRGMTPTCAFMLSPHEDDVSDTEAALVAAVHTYNIGAGVRLNPLTVYAGTGIDLKAPGGAPQYSSAKARLLLDGHWTTEQNGYARERPWLYPFHCTVGPPARYDRFIAATRMCFTLLDHFPRTLMRWIHHADGALWPEILDAAAQVDHASVDRALWGIAEAEAFAQSLWPRRLPTEVRDTLTFELAEHRLRRPAVDRPLRLDVEDTTLDFALRRHALIDLARPPTAYETTEAVPHGPVDAQKYLLVPGDTSVRYLEPDRNTVELLGRLDRAATDGAPAAARAADVAELMAAKVLHLRSPSSTEARSEGATP